MDNKQILEALDDIVTFREEPTSEQIEALIEAMDIVEKYSKIGGWIPCSERLPECEWGAETGALLYQHKGTGSIEVGYYGRGGKFRDSYFRHYRNSTDGVDSKDVVAWQPLPEAYHE